MKFFLGSVFGCQLPGMNILPTSSSWQISTWSFKSCLSVLWFLSIFKPLRLVKEIKYLTNKQSCILYYCVLHHVNVCYTLWLCVTTCDGILHFMTVFSTVWLYVTLYDCVLSCVTLFYAVLLYILLCDYLLHCTMTMFVYNLFLPFHMFVRPDNEQSTSNISSELQIPHL